MIGPVIYEQEERTERWERRVLRTIYRGENTRECEYEGRIKKLVSSLEDQVL